MHKLNCWEFKKCGRDAGENTKGTACPVFSEIRLNGVHGGIRAGRACWVVAGTQCGGKEQGTFAVKYHDCEKCDFYSRVRREEGPNYELSIVILRKLKTTGTIHTENP